MAKTKLIGAVESAMRDLAAQMDLIDNSFRNFEGIDDSDLNKLSTRYEAAKTAMNALGTHLDNLHRRENNPKLGDRLRNLKNVFKDQQDLSAKRKAIKEKFDSYQKDLALVHKDIQDTIGVVKYANEHYQ
jgi:DNA repair ATPase RecN